MISITLIREDWEAVCDALDRVGYHSIAEEINGQASRNEDPKAQERAERYFARRVREEDRHV